MAIESRGKAIKRPKVRANEAVLSSKMVNRRRRVSLHMAFNSVVFVGEPTSPANKLQNAQPAPKLAQLVISLQIASI